MVPVSISQHPPNPHVQLTHSPSPVFFQPRLRELRDKSLQSGSQTRFFLPYSYCPGRRFDLNRSTAPLCDRYLMNNHVMIAAKDALPAWFWISCNLALNRALSSGALPGRGASASVERVYAMRAACKFFNEHRARYASRPAAPIASARVSGGEELDLLPKFRLWLGCAPRISGNSRGTDTWGPPNCKDGLVFRSGGYEWDAEYLEELFRQLCGLVDALGLGDDGWRSLRWEVYHQVRALCCRVRCHGIPFLTVRFGLQYAMSVDGGLCYDACGRFWSDPAAVWLEGQIVPDPAPDSVRGRCAEGLRYNGLLEVMSAVDNVRTTGSFGSSGNGNASPVRVPSQAAGPSSA